MELSAFNCMLYDHNKLTEICRIRDTDGYRSALQYLTLPAVKDSGFKTSKSGSADHDEAADILESCTGPIPITSNKTTENAIFFPSVFSLQENLPFSFLLNPLPFSTPATQATEPLPL